MPYEPLLCLLTLVIVFCLCVNLFITSVLNVFNRGIIQKGFRKQVNVHKSMKTFRKVEDRQTDRQTDLAHQTESLTDRRTWVTRQTDRQKG